jgi:hypothetical protein
MLKGFASRSSRVPFFNEFRKIVGMDCSLLPPARQVVQRRSRILLPSLIYELNGTVRQSAHDQRRNRVETVRRSSASSF